MQAMYDRLEKEHQRDYRKHHNGYYKGYNKFDIAAFKNSKMRESRGADSPKSLQKQ